MSLRTFRHALHAVHLTALGLWCGSLLMTGAAAAVTFPMLKKLAPTLPGYSGYTGDHWMLAAGHVVDRVFAISDVVQFVCAMLATASMLIAAVFGGLAWRRPGGGVMARAVILAAALMVLGYHLLVLTPRMGVNLKQYWALAAAGQTAEAETFRAAFSADHPMAQRVMASLALLSFAGLVLGALAGADGGRAVEATSAGCAASRSTNSTSQLEPPALLREGAR